MFMSAELQSRSPEILMHTTYCLHKSIRIVNAILNIFGAAMIIYALWLGKKWSQAVSELPSSSSVPEPWFITACLGVGMAVCLSTLLGFAVAHYISNSMLAIYIGSICSLLLIQGAVIVLVFYEMDWQSKISESMDDKNKGFENFFLFHVGISRLLTIAVFMAQLVVAFLTVILWSLGTETIRHGSNPNAPNSTTHSFLVDHNSPLLENP